MSSHQTTDIAIAGAGLAGLTLALQLKQQSPELDITLIERNEFPVPDATAKVGESTVEIGAHYLHSVLQQQQHLQDEHLPKFGLRCFFGAPQSPLSNLDELGSSKEFSVPTYQVDRGVLENHLAAETVRNGVKLYSGESIARLDINASGHRLSTGRQTINARWFVDASGRRGLVKRRLQLARDNTHYGSAVWFRIDKTVKVDDWSECSDWAARCQPAGQRYLSTNHLMGSGYWVWIIPLRSGVTSIGIVFDAGQHQLQELNTFDKAQQWLQRHQPHCAAAIEGATALDFRYLKDYSYDCKKIFSDDRWALTGESGVFLDPFYSPGTDFIAIGNGYISDLIRRDVAGEDTRVRNAVYQKLYMSFYQNTLSLYQDEYAGFGDRTLMSLKLLWDYAFYWGILGWLFIKQQYIEIAFIQRITRQLAVIGQCNARLQALFRQRAARKIVLPAEGLFIDHSHIPCLVQFNAVLAASTPESFDHSQFTRNADTLKTLAALVEALLMGTDSGVSLQDEQAVIGCFREYVR